MKITVENFRSFRNKTTIDFKPLTIFLGANSVGKSSFIRIYPLIKQTLARRRSEPILWYGDLVDFGSFLETKNFGSKKDEIFFEFSFNSTNYYSGFTRTTFNRSTEKIKINCQIYIKEKYISKIIYKIYDHEIKLLFNEKNEVNNIIINGVGYIDDGIRSVPTIELLPNIDFRIEQYYESIDFSRGRHFHIDRLNIRNLKYLKTIMHKSTTIETILTYLSKIRLDSKENMLKKIQMEKLTPSFSRDLNQMNLDSEIIQNIINNYLFDRLGLFNELINDEIRNNFVNIRYLEPVRASAQRYYRKVGLQVDEIDSTGENLPMFLASITRKERKNFEEWIENKFNFKILSEQHQGHISLKIIKNNKVTNIADTGYGISQIVPILTQLWKIKYDIIKDKAIPIRYRGMNYGLVIEQPELHLHPKMQSILVDVFVETVNEIREVHPNFKLIIETHSDVFINKLGKTIAMGRFKEEDASVIIFKEDNEGNTIAELSTYDKDGILKNWPIGFFGVD